MRTTWPIGRWTAAVAIAGALGAAAAQAGAATAPAAQPAVARPGAPAAGATAATGAPAATGGAPAPAAAPLAPPAAMTNMATAPVAARGLIADPAPRPATSVRVQSRYAVKARQFQLFAGAEYLSRGDFYISPGARIGGTYYALEQLGVELQLSHFWSSLNGEAERIKRTLGAIPDSHAPGWLALAGARYSFGYGKFMVGGLGGVLHFEPQLFARGGFHVHDGDFGPSADVGFGFLVFLTPKLFARIDASLVYEREQRSGQTVSVWGTLPSISVGGTL